jgi:peptidoglycan/LPS O-acetylase OafA/YrhL
VIRLLATQLIVWHHLAFYGPMSDVVFPYAETLISALYEHGRLAVQVFLVMGGYLAARSLLPLLAPPACVGNRARQPVLGLIWRRYLRLTQPLVVALLLAVVCAAVARSLMDHDSTPEAPSWDQLAAHVLLLQDVLGFDGLSAGVWYLAIDFQLYALLVSWIWVSRQLSRWVGGRTTVWFWSGTVALTVAALLWFNLQPGMDRWAIYFFGSYGLGVLAHGLASQRPHNEEVATLVLGGLLVLSLLVDWRGRILLAGLVAIGLALASGVSSWPRWTQGPLVRYLTRISYAQFLVHYPVCLLVNALVTSAWPESPAMNALGLLLAWCSSIAVAGVFHGLVEQRLQAVTPLWPFHVLRTLAPRM